MGNAKTATGLTLDERGAILTITVATPAEKNRLFPEALTKLEEIGLGLLSNGEINAVIVTGEGQNDFCSGLLNPVVRGAMSKDDVIALVRLANRAFNALEMVPQIVIGSLNGEVRAGGAELALACDIRLAASHATMQFPEAAWGGFPGAGGPARLASVVGRGRALELICTGRAIDAGEMAKIGLVQGIFDSRALADESAALAARIAAAGPLATRGAKRIINARFEPGTGHAQDVSDALRHELEWSQDVDEALAAHREKRAPVFKGR